MSPTHVPAPAPTRRSSRARAFPILALLVVLLPSAAPAQGAPATEDTARHGLVESSASNGGQETVPEITETERELLDADRAFAGATAEAGARGWASWFLPDGEMIVPGSHVRGRGEILVVMRRAFSDPAYRIRWSPERARVGAGGGTGFTVGSYETVTTGAAGRPVTTEGRYLTVWRRDEEGRWRVSLDVGIPDPEPGGGP